MIDMVKSNGFTNKFTYSTDNAKEIWTAVLNRKYFIKQIHVAYIVLCLVVCVQLLLGSMNREHFIALLIEGVVLYAFEFYKDLKIKNIVKASHNLYELEYKIVCYNSGLSFMIDGVEASFSWKEIKNITETKNFYILNFKDGKSIIPINKLGFLYNAKIEDFESLLKEKIKA